jgi:ABC-type transporter Mla MlaB component
MRTPRPPPEPTVVVSFDVSAFTAPDIGLVDALARLQLSARRQGAEVRLRDAPSELLELLVLAGLDDIVREEGPA